VLIEKPREMEVPDGKLGDLMKLIDTFPDTINRDAARYLAKLTFVLAYEQVMIDVIEARKEIEMHADAYDTIYRHELMKCLRRPDDNVC